MKQPFFFCLLLTATSFCSGASSLDGVVSTFTIPPFQEEGTVAGIDGWKMISSGDPESAIVRSFGDSQTGLLLSTYGIQKELEEPLDAMVTVTVKLQFGFVSEKGNASQFVFMPMLGVGVGSAQFGFSNADISAGEPGGFYYTEKLMEEDDKIIQKKVFLLPRDAIFENAKYTLSMVMDLDRRTYVLTISGVDSSGSPVEMKSDEISMSAPGQPSSPAQKLTGIRLTSRLPASTELYVESITLAQTP